MAKRVSVDKWLFCCTLLLTAIGLVMVFSASAVMAKDKFGSPYEFVFRQMVWAAAGIGLMVLLMNLDYRRLKHPAVVFSVLGVTTLLLILVFFLDRSHNTHRWIRMGALSFQPSELAKPALILFLAWFLHTRAKAMHDLKQTLLPAIAPTVALSALIVMQPDLGTAMMCTAVTGTILFAAGMQLRWFAVAALPVVTAFGALIWFTPWRWQRILAFMDPYADPQGSGFHIIQSMIAVGTGGFAGQGLMEGKQKLFYLPEPQNDFIFAVLAEEFGLLGGVVVLFLFGTLCYRGFRAAVLTQDLFGKYLAVGITSLLVIQALFNISVVLALLPTKGIPLPFISSGGSALLFSLASIGVLLNITQQTD